MLSIIIDDDDLKIPLSFINKPLDQSVLQNGYTELECFVRSSLTPTFTWTFTRKGQLQLIVDGHNPLTSGYFIKLGERSQTLIIRETKWIHEGSYKCDVSTDNGTIYAGAELNVLGKYKYINNPWIFMINFFSCYI